MWGPALSHDEYLTREAYLTTVPLAKQCGITHWVLTDSSLLPDQRPIFSSCETLRKRAVSCTPGPGGEPILQDGIAHGIASVFTDPQFRGKGYASRMMQELGPKLSRWQDGHQAANGGHAGGNEGDDNGPGVLFSVLYSDIGKIFYARKGWAPFESSHVSFPPVPRPASRDELQNGGHTNGSVEGKADIAATPIGYHELAELCAVDEGLLRKSLVRRVEAAAAGDGQAKKACVALLPDLDTILWHLMREDFMTKHIFGRTPSARGAVYGEVGRRMWAVWTRGYYGGLEKREANTLHILRFVIEDENCPEDYLGEGFQSIIQIAQAEAAEWLSQDVQMWNPTPKLKRLVRNSGIQFGFVDRDSQSIASLMWYGNGRADDLDWVANEKFGWC
jgi:hypothetical protein